MLPRHTLIECFSTFLHLEDDRFRGWVTDSRLRRSMEHCLKQKPDPQATESFWAVYWHQVWQNHLPQKRASSESDKTPAPAQQLAEGHLSAYLQESCFWAAYKVLPRVASNHHNLADCFQVAIAEVPRILRTCDPTVSTSLKTYASVAFGNIIRERLRQRREIDLCSDWGLLLKLSRKQLRESLEAAGLGPTVVEAYLLAWACFVANYQTKTPSLRKTAAPDRDTWATIARDYTSRQPPSLDPTAQPTVQQLEQWLGRCAHLARLYLYPQVSSLNVNKPGQETAELADSLTNPEQLPPLEALVVQEETQARQEQRQQLHTILTGALDRLDDQSRQLIQLYYQQNLTQQQIARQLGVQQYTVSRKLAKVREALLLALARWSEEILHNPPTSSVIKDIGNRLEEWLQGYYQSSDQDSAREGAL